MADADEGPRADVLGNRQNEAMNPEIPCEGNPQKIHLTTKPTITVTSETEKLVDRAVKKARFNIQKNPSGKFEAEDEATEIFIQAKLREWDKNESGDFNRDEILAIMEEWRLVNTQRRKLKVKIGIGSLVVTMSVVMMFASLVVAFLINQSGAPQVGDHGNFQASSENGRTDVVVTDERRRDDTDLNHILAFDDRSDQWVISDQQLREVDMISFTHGNADYHLGVAHVVRTDSGPLGSSDTMEVETIAGHRIRYWENTTTLDAKWVGTSEWFEVDLPDDNGRRLSDEPPGVWIVGPEDFAQTSFGALTTFGSDLEPPRGRRAKGYVAFHGGSNYGRSTSGNNYNRDECYRTNASHYYCGAACGLSKLAGGLVVVLALLAGSSSSQPTR